MAQINDYLIEKHLNVSPVAEETLYDFWGGSNDIFGILENTTSGNLDWSGYRSAHSCYRNLKYSAFISPPLASINEPIQSIPI
jgi:hypothetical protein